jgi:hypothetical protein
MNAPVNAVRARYYPAAVLLPGEQQPWQRVAVYLADDGIHIYRQPTEQADFEAPVNWDATHLPAVPNAAGIYVTLADGGVVSITANTGCSSCGSRLAQWAGPSWARFERARG